MLYSCIVLIHPIKWPMRTNRPINGRILWTHLARVNGIPRRARRTTTLPPCADRHRIAKNEQPDSKLTDSHSYTIITVCHFSPLCLTHQQYAAMATTTTTASLSTADATHLNTLRAELKGWEKAFAEANGGRKAGRHDIKQDPEIGMIFSFPFCLILTNQFLYSCQIQNLRPTACS
jgi:DNA replication and checkpoint protein